jgi:DNA (cytosine-5)-methyltransferase 1
MIRKSRLNLLFSKEIGRTLAAVFMNRLSRTAPRKAAGPTCIDLFAGAGGLAEGFRQAGFRILSANDAAATAARTFQKNFPEATVFVGSVSRLSGKELLADAGLQRGELDCLIGGPPCQSFSYNNHERSRRKARARLFRDYLRIVGVLQPKCLVMENVPGILTVGSGAVVSEIYESLKELGYECEARILYSEDYGVPQQRRRVFFVATRLGWSSSLFPRGNHGPAPKPQGGSNNEFVYRWRAPKGESLPMPPTVWDAIGDLPSLQNGAGEEEEQYAVEPQSTYQQLMRGTQSVLLNHVAPRLGEKMLKRIAHVPEGGNWRDIPFRLLPAGMQRACESDHTKRYGRLSRCGLCCTILTKCDPHWGSYVHPLDQRAISVREAARLQSFPDGFIFLGFRSEQFQQVGNAVPPLMAAAMGKAIRKHLQRNDRQVIARAA